MDKQLRIIAVLLLLCFPVMGQVLTPVYTVHPASGTPFVLGLNFRTTANYVTDGANETCVRAGGVSGTCPGDLSAHNNDNWPITRSSPNYGVGLWIQGQSSCSDCTRDRSNTVDRRLAGVVFNNSGMAQQVLLQWVPTGVSCTLTGAIGDEVFDHGDQYVELRDGDTVFNTVDKNTGTTADHFYDLAGNLLTGAQWVASNGGLGGGTAITHTFTYPLLRLVLGSATRSANVASIAIKCPGATFSQPTYFANFGFEDGTIGPFNIDCVISAAFCGNSFTSYVAVDATGGHTGTKSLKLVCTLSGGTGCPAAFGVQFTFAYPSNPMLTDNGIYVSWWQSYNAAWKTCMAHNGGGNQTKPALGRDYEQAGVTSGIQPIWGFSQNSTNPNDLNFVIDTGVPPSYNDLFAIATGTSSTGYYREKIFIKRVIGTGTISAWYDNGGGLVAIVTNRSESGIGWDTTDNAHHLNLRIGSPVLENAGCADGTYQSNIDDITVSTVDPG